MPDIIKSNNLKILAAAISNAQSAYDDINNDEDSAKEFVRMARQGLERLEVRLSPYWKDGTDKRQPSSHPDPDSSLLHIYDGGTEFDY